MAIDNGAYWAVHAGDLPERDQLFRSGTVAVGWADLGDLSHLPASRPAFRAAVAEQWPDWSPGKVQNSASQLFRFVHEMSESDAIVYPCKTTREVFYGKITGLYHHIPSSGPDGELSNRRAVSWEGKISRDLLTQGAKYELGSALTLFQFKNYADDFRIAIGRTSARLGTITSSDADLEEKEDETIELVAAQVEESTAEFVLDQLLRHSKGYPFQRIVAGVLYALGYKVRESAPGVDGGIDLVARRDELELEPPLIKVQVKSGDVGDPVVSALCGKLGQGDLGLVVTLGGFSRQARDFEKSKSNLRLIDGEQFVELFLEHYERLDASLKASVQLKRVYLPVRQR
jgi:restriction system protein